MSRDAQAQAGDSDQLDRPTSNDDMLFIGSVELHHMGRVMVDPRGFFLAERY